MHACMCACTRACVRVCVRTRVYAAYIHNAVSTAARVVLLGLCVALVRGYVHHVSFCKDVGNLEVCQGHCSTPSLIPCKALRHCMVQCDAVQYDGVSDECLLGWPKSYTPSKASKDFTMNCNMHLLCY